MTGAGRPIACWLCGKPIRGTHSITAVGPECAVCTADLETPLPPKQANDIAAFRERAAKQRAERAR